MSSTPSARDQQPDVGLEQGIREQFLGCGSSQTSIHDLTVTVEEWRSAARAVARNLQRPIKTFVAGNSVFAVLGDWPRDDDERAIHELNVQNAAATMNEYIKNRLGVE